MKSLYHLIIIHGNTPELGIQGGQPGIIFDCRLVDFNHLERLAEDAGGDKVRFGAHTRLVEQCQETGVVCRIEADGVPEHCRVCFGLSSCATRTGRIFIFLFHVSFL